MYQSNMVEDNGSNYRGGTEGYKSNHMEESTSNASILDGLGEQTRGNHPQSSL